MLEVSVSLTNISKPLILLGIPRNEKIMNMFLEYAVKNAKTPEEKTQVDFYSVYLRKLTALQQGIF